MGIVSPDKDMKQIPGKLYNLEDTTYITHEEGARWHLIQTLAGDQTDGYSGVPGIGVKRAETLFNEEDALLNARLARILTVEDYDSKEKEPRLWTPEASYTINDGTGLQDASY